MHVCMSVYLYLYVYDMYVCEKDCSSRVLYLGAQMCGEVGGARMNECAQSFGSWLDGRRAIWPTS